MIRWPISVSVSRQLEPVEEVERARDRHLRQLVDRPAADRDREHLGLEARALAGRARPEAHVLLDPLALLARVGLPVAPLEARDDAPRRRACTTACAPSGCGTGRRPCRRPCRAGTGPAAPRSARSTACRGVDLVAVGDRLDHRLVERRAAHRPRHERALVDRERRVGDEQVGVDLLLRAEPGAARAGAVRRVEGEDARLELRQADAVLGAGEALRVERRLAVSTTSIATSPSASAIAVSTESVSRWRRSSFITSRSTTTSIVCLNFLSSSISSSSSRCSPSTLTRVKPSPRSCSSRSRYSPLRSRTTGALTVNFVPSGSRRIWSTIDSIVLAGDRPPADRAVRPADPRVQEAQVVVDLRHRADRRARVPRRRLLVDRDRRREAVDRVDVGLLHHLEELARVGRERLDVAALALRVDRVEGERGLPGPREPGDADQRVPRQADGDVLEVVLAGAVDDELVGRHEAESSPGSG